MIKIAFATDDLINISPHIGRAKKYIIYTIEKSQVIPQEERRKPAHRDQEEHAHHDEHFHDDVARGSADCQFVIARGMGSPALKSLEKIGVQSILTELTAIQDVLQAYLDGRLEHHPNRVH